MGEAHGDGGGAGPLAAWYDAHAAWMYRHALMLVTDHAAAEDAVQQVFAKLASMDGRLESVDHARAYLRRTVRGECYRMLARERRGTNRRPLLEPAAAEVEHGGEREELEAALRALPPEQREVVHLKVYEAMTFEQIATVLEVSPNTAASRYRYAIEKLRKFLEARR